MRDEGTASEGDNKKTEPGGKNGAGKGEWVTGRKDYE